MLKEQAYFGIITIKRPDNIHMRVFEPKIEIYSSC